MPAEDYSFRGSQFLNKIYYAVIYFMAVVVFVLLCLNAYHIIKSIPNAILSENKQSFDELIAQILTFFILVELTRVFTEYLEFKMVRLHLMAEITSIFILREILVMLYLGKFDWIKIVSFSILLLSVVAVRTISIRCPTK